MGDTEINIAISMAKIMMHHGSGLRGIRFSDKAYL
jgi:hypothetical protein